MSAHRRSTFQPSQPGTVAVVIRIDWQAVILGAVVFALILAGMLTLGAIARATDPLLNAPAPAATGLPPCTDAIADARGMCEGPLVETLPPCATEDSTGCYWDAQTMGNRQGHDVVRLTEGE